jgi:hypothetical protein
MYIMTPDQDKYSPDGKIIHSANSWDRGTNTIIYKHLVVACANVQLTEFAARAAHIFVCIWSNLTRRSHSLINQEWEEKIG